MRSSSSEKYSHQPRHSSSDPKSTSAPSAPRLAPPSSACSVPLFAVYANSLGGLALGAKSKGSNALTLAFLRDTQSNLALPIGSRPPLAPPPSSARRNSSMTTRSGASCRGTSN
eukprot:9503173-Pyramimonas_sp.AAC.1